MIFMAESNLTKKALAQALKELTQTQPFEKVGINDICNACHVSRKTFYYHFRDKYALAEWIFDTEIIELLQKCNLDDYSSMVLPICQYLYQNRTFYVSLMHYQGQNAFRAHFQDFLFSAVEKFLLPEYTEIDAVADMGGIDADETQTFYAHFLADAILSAIYRWMSEGAKLPPEKFAALLKSTEVLIQIKAHQQQSEPKEHPGV